MTYSKSGWYVQTLLDVVTGVAMVGTPTGQLLLTGNDANEKISLVSASATDYTAPVNTVSTTLGVWSNTDEVTGTNWLTGGQLVSTGNAGGAMTTTVTNPASSPGLLQYSWTNPLSVASTTISTAIFGFIIYFHLITTPVKPCLLTIYVGGSGGYTTTNGTLSITPSGSGLSQLTVTA